MTNVTDCYNGIGLGYSGEAKETINGLSCSNGFCENNNESSFDKPFCSTRLGSAECIIPQCDFSSESDSTLITCLSFDVHFLRYSISRRPINFGRL